MRERCTTLRRALDLRVTKSQYKAEDALVIWTISPYMSQMATLEAGSMVVEVTGSQGLLAILTRPSSFSTLETKSFLKVRVC